MTNVSSVKPPSGFVRTPTWPLIATSAFLGTLLLLHALLTADETTWPRLNVLHTLQAAVGGLSLGLALGMTRHRLAAARSAPARLGLGFPSGR